MLVYRKNAVKYYQVHRVFLSLEMLEMRFTDATDKEGDEKKKTETKLCCGTYGIFNTLQLFSELSPSDCACQLTFTVKFCYFS